VEDRVDPALVAARLLVLVIGAVPGVGPGVGDLVRLPLDPISGTTTFPVMSPPTTITSGL
jgi:hypothetical protein